MRRWLVVPISVIIPALLAAQTPEPAAPAAPAPPTPSVLDTVTADIVTAQTVAGHVRVLADDSLRGRDTPSPGLEAAARYVANQFKTLGLRTGVGNHTWFQRYRIPPRLDFTQSRVVFTANGKRVVADFSTAAQLASRTVMERAVPGNAILIAGRLKSTALAKLDVNNKVVLYVPQPNVDPATEWEFLERLRAESRGVVIVSDLDSAAFTRGLRSSLDESEVHLGTRWSVYVRPENAPGLVEMLRASGVDLAQARKDTTLQARDLFLVIALEAHFRQTMADTMTAPNVVGVLEGSDPKFKDEYILFMAHMDHTGSRPGHPDSIANGADDNASGVAGLIELARAFSQPGARPARSLVFLATSGGAKDSWGSREFVEQLDIGNSDLGFGGGVQIVFGISEPNEPTVTPAPSTPSRLDGVTVLVTPDPQTRDTATSVVTIAPRLALQNSATGPSGPSGVADTAGTGDVAITRIVAAINLDMIGRPADNSVVVSGLSEVEVPTPLTWLIAAHPELNLALINGGTAVSTESDHFPFIQRAVPSLFFHNGSHTDPAAESAATIDADLAARIVRLVFYVGRDIGNSKQLPQWNADGRRRYLQVVRQP